MAARYRRSAAQPPMAHARRRSDGRSLRQRERQRRRRRIRILIVLASVLGSVLAAALVFVLVLGGIFDRGTGRIENAFPEETDRPAPTQADAVNILLLGSDVRGELGDIDDLSGQRSDSILVMHVAADRQSMHVMSIMRDSWVEIPGYGMNKVNAALSLGGVPLAVQTVESIIDARIDRIAIVDFEGFKGITEALGGVTVDNPVAFRSIDRYDFAQGPIELEGDEALSFVRERKAFPDGDFQRARNQQAFIKAVMAKTLTAETLTNPARITGLVSAIAPHLAVDDGFTSVWVGGLAVTLTDVRVEDVTFFTLPSTGTGMVGSQSVVFVDEDELALIRTAFRDDALDGYTPPPPPG